MTAAQLSLTRPPTVLATMLIRRPVAEVFAALVDPEITTKFWFTSSSGRMEPGARLRWDWEMYGVWADVLVKEFEPDCRVLMEWGSPGETYSPVEWTFDQRDEGTLVSVSTYGFTGTGDEIVAQAIDGMGGFTMVLAAMKALLEHGIVLTVVADHLGGNSDNV